MFAGTIAGEDTHHQMTELTNHADRHCCVPPLTRLTHDHEIVVPHSLGSDLCNLTIVCGSITIIEDTDRSCSTHCPQISDRTQELSVRLTLVSHAAHHHGISGHQRGRTAHRGAALSIHTSKFFATCTSASTSASASHYLQANALLLLGVAQQQLRLGEKCGALLYEARTWPMLWPRRRPLVRLHVWSRSSSRLHLPVL